MSNVIFVADDIDLGRIPTRGYDFNKGDRRFTDQERAVEHAERTAIDTGVRQVVRRDPGSYAFQAFWLVQAVGS